MTTNSGRRGRVEELAYVEVESWILVSGVKFAPDSGKLQSGSVTEKGVTGEGVVLSLHWSRCEVASLSANLTATLREVGQEISRSWNLNV